MGEYEREQARLLKLMEECMHDEEGEIAEMKYDEKRMIDLLGIKNTYFIV